MTENRANLSTFRPKIQEKQKGLDEVYLERQRKMYDEDLSWNSSYQIIHKEQCEPKIIETPLEINGDLEKLKINRKFIGVGLKAIIQLPSKRQEYFKSLSIDKLQQEPEFKFLFKKPYKMFDIAYQYSKSIVDDGLNEEVIQSHKKKEFIQQFLIGSLCCYRLSLYLIRKYKPFNGLIRKKHLKNLPLAIASIALFQQTTIFVRRRQLLTSSQNADQFKLLLQKYLCQTTEEQRKEIFR